MAKKKVIEEIAEEALEETGVATPIIGFGRPTSFREVLPITQEFGNGDLNVLRDKINEIIIRL